MSATLSYEAAVAERFDLLEGRFKQTVAADDPRLSALLQTLKPVPGMRVLDLGCGKGRFASRLASLGATIVGLDRSAGMLAGGSSGARVLGSAGRLPFASGVFDAVVAVEVVQHLPPGGLDQAINEAARVLRPGGILAIVDRNAGALDAKRPWMPSLALKAMDERRGRWMYPAGGPVRERWFWPGTLRRRLAERFALSRVEFPLMPEEANSPWHRRLPRTRRMALWTATGPRGVFLG